MKYDTSTPILFSQIVLNRAAAQEVAKSRPDDVLVQSLFVPQVRAAAALNSGNAAKAIELLKPANAYHKANTQVLYVRGLACCKAGLGSEAAQEFQNILALRGVAPSDPLMSFAHLGLGRTYALEGDSQKSRTAYQDFFALWKDAETDIPILKEAKAEYAKLHSFQRSRLETSVTRPFVEPRR